MSKPMYRIPQPQRLRRIQHSFAWIDHRLLRSGFVQTMTHQDQSLYLFLALAADRNGVSFYRKEKICSILGLDFGEFEVARDRLLDMGLIAFQTYSALSVNGFYQLLPVAGRPPDFASATPAAAAPPGAASAPAAAAASAPSSDPPVRGPRASPTSRTAATPSAGPAGSTSSPQAGSPPAATPRALPSVAEMASRLAAAFKTI